jgi:hypothetical protein
MSLSRHQNAGQNLDLKISNRSFKNVSQFIYLGKTAKESKFDSRRYEEETEFGKCLLPFSPQTFVFSSAVKNSKN